MTGYGAARATIGHAAALAAIHAAAFAPSERWDDAAMASLLAMPGVFGLVDEAGGMALARVVADEAELLSIAVLPGARRRGLAARLLQAVLEQTGPVPVFLEVSEDNAAARALYARAGFVACGRRPAYYGPGRDALVLRRAAKPCGSSPG